MKKMYQVPTDMMPRRTRMVMDTGLRLATMSPRPYGFSVGAFDAAGGVMTGAAGAGAAAGAIVPPAGAAPVAGAPLGAAMVGAGGAGCAIACPTRTPDMRTRAAAIVRC